MTRIYTTALLLASFFTAAPQQTMAETIDIRIGSNSDKAAAVLLEKLNEKGAERGLSFRRSEDDFDFKLIVTWRHGRSHGRAPRARVDVYDRAGMPQLTVDREGRGFTRSSAVGRCAKELVELFPSMLSKRPAHDGDPAVREINVMARPGRTNR